MNNSNNSLRVKTKHGYFVANQSEDISYPGIDIEFISENESWKDLSRPRVLFEITPYGELRVLIWNNRDNEDYTEEVIFETFGKGESRCEEKRSE